MANYTVGPHKKVDNLYNVLKDGKPIFVFNYPVTAERVAKRLNEAFSEGVETSGTKFKKKTIEAINALK